MGREILQLENLEDLSLQGHLVRIIKETERRLKGTQGDPEQIARIIDADSLLSILSWSHFPEGTKEDNELSKSVQIFGSLFSFIIKEAVVCWM